MRILTHSCAVFLLLTALCLPAAAAEADVIALLKEKNVSLVSIIADFTQETRIPLFNSPVISTGRLVFERPDAVRWEYISPMREGFAMKGGKGIRWRDELKNAEPFTVSADPIGGLIARQLPAWITLDLGRIEKEYAIAVAGAEPPTLRLTPKRADVASVLKELVIAFHPTGVAQSVTIAETQGGVTVIRFTNVRVNEPVPAEEFP